MKANKVNTHPVFTGGILRSLMRIGIVAFVVFQASSCAVTEPSIDEQYNAKLLEAWSAFEGGDYGLAEIRFSEAMGINTTGSEAYLGRGWSRLLQERAAEARSDFTYGAGLASVTVDYYAGLALAYYLIEYYAETVTSATQALNAKSDYAFTHLPKYDYRDIRFLRASANFAQGEGKLTEVIVDVNFLATDLGLGFEIDSADPSTWIIEGEVYESLPAVLTAALDIISEIVS